MWHDVEGAEAYRLFEASTGPHLTLANGVFLSTRVQGMLRVVSGTKEMSSTTC